MRVNTLIMIAPVKIDEWEKFHRTLDTGGVFIRFNPDGYTDHEENYFKSKECNKEEIMVINHKWVERTLHCL